MESWAQYGLAGLVAGSCFALAWRVLDRAWAVVEAKVSSSPSSLTGSPPGFLACQVDPLHFQRIREVHEKVESWDVRVQRGDFSCVWRDRDEIRDLLETLRSSSTETRNALREMTRALRSLEAQLRTNAGGGPRP